MWIIPKHNALSAYAPDTVGSNLDLSEQASLCSQSLMWRSKPGPSRTWLTRLKRVPWLRHLSIRMLKPSLTENFEARYTASLGVIPASPSAQRESGSEKTTRDTSGHGLQMEFDFVGQTGASLRTSKDISARGWRKSWTTWKDLVTQRRGEYSVRLKSARRTNENGCSSWPTATTAEGGKIGCKANYGQIALSNHPAIVGLPDREKLNKSGRSRGLSEQWPTVTAREWKGSGNASMRKDGKSRMDTLDAIVRHGLPDREKLNTNGKSQGLFDQAQTNSSKKLNPDWVSQLMGVPVGWVHPRGVRNRTDELRMLGNGVVPATAAKAFVTLFSSPDIR